jgi:hypothetical protein
VSLRGTPSPQQSPPLLPPEGQKHSGRVTKDRRGGPMPSNSDFLTWRRPPGRCPRNRFVASPFGTAQKNQKQWPWLGAVEQRQLRWGLEVDITGVIVPLPLQLDAMSEHSFFIVAVIILDRISDSWTREDLVDAARVPRAEGVPVSLHARSDGECFLVRAHGANFSSGPTARWLTPGPTPRNLWPRRYGDDAATASAPGAVHGFTTADGAALPWSTTSPGPSLRSCARIVCCL